MNDGYPYSDGKLLEERNTYFYSKFLGMGFFDQWKGARNSVLAELVVSKRPLVEQKKIAIVENEGVIRTESLLSSLYNLLGECEQGVDEITEVWLPILIQRFEVSKRVHESYMSIAPFRPEKGSSYRNLSLYLRFAEVMELTWRKKDFFPALNVFLKLIDILCAYSQEIEQSEQERLRKLILREEEIVKEVGLSLGVSL